MEQNEKEFGQNQNDHWHSNMHCAMCGYGHGHRLLRLLLGLLILGIVFCIGFKMGEFRGEYGGGFEGQYGRHMMKGYGPMMYQASPGYPGGMMGNSSIPMMNATTTPKK